MEGLCESLGGPPDEDGLWVVEGSVHSYTTHGMDGTEYDEEFDGYYRRMTEEEQAVWVEDQGTIQALWDEERDAVVDEWPCQHCGLTFKEHRKAERLTTHIAVVHPMAPVRLGIDKTYPCPPRDDGNTAGAALPSGG